MSIFFDLAIKRAWAGFLLFPSFFCRVNLFAEMIDRRGPGCVLGPVNGPEQVTYSDFFVVFCQSEIDRDCVAFLVPPIRR